MVSNSGEVPHSVFKGTESSTRKPVCDVKPDRMKGAPRPGDMDT